MSEFSDRPLVAGSLIGLRSFKVDTLGRLTGVTVRDVWTPGDNIAQCRRGSESLGYGGLFAPMTFRMTHQMLYGGQTVSVPMMSDETTNEPVTEKKREHRVGDLKCGCGFYAYFDNASNPHHGKGNLHGLIEGYGVLTVGSRGFRAEKAKLLALVVKPKRADELLVQRVMHNYPDVPVFPSKAEALAAYPLTPPPIPTPETCNEFWSQPVTP